MSVILQVRVNGGAPQTGGITVVAGDVIQLTAANKSTWSTGTIWRISSFPSGFSLPAGWSSDASGYYFLGNSDPPSFTIGSWWGKLGLILTAQDGTALKRDTATAISVRSPANLRGIFRGEGAQFGGTREQWVGELKADMEQISTWVALVPTTYQSGDTLAPGNFCILEDDGDTTPSFILPAPATWRGTRIMVKRLNQPASAATITVAGGALIDGLSSYTLVGSDVAAELWSDGTSVYVGPNDAGGGGGPPLSTDPPVAITGTAAAGSTGEASDAGHTHPITSLTRTAAGDLTISTASGAVRITPSNGFAYLPTYTWFGNGGSFSQWISPRFTAAHPVSGIWLDFNAFTLEGTIGYSQEIRMGDSVSRPFLAFNGRLSTDVPEVGDIGDLMRALTRVGLITSTQTGYTVALVGDSLWSVGATIPSERACEKIEANIPNARIVNLTRPGDGATSPAHAYRRFPVGGKSIVVLTYSINNFLAGQDAATVQTRYAAEVAAALAAGADEVIACTCVSAGTAVLSAGQNTQRLAFNSWLLANFASIGCVSVIDVAATPNLTNPANPTYFLDDQLHFTNAGHTSYAAAFTAGINARLTGASIPQQNISSGGVLVNLNGGAGLLQETASVKIDQQDIEVTRTMGFADAIVRYTPADVVTTDATPTVLWSWPTTTNRISRIKARVTASNDTDNEGATFDKREASCRNVGGTVTQIGTVTPASPDDHKDPTLSAATVTLQFSGGNMQAIGTGVAGKTIRWRPVIWVQEVTLA